MKKGFFSSQWLMAGAILFLSAACQQKASKPSMQQDQQQMNQQQPSMNMGGSCNTAPQQCVKECPCPKKECKPCPTPCPCPAPCPQKCPSECSTPSCGTESNQAPVSAPSDETPEAYRTAPATPPRPSTGGTL